MKRELPAGWVPDPRGGYSKPSGQRLVPVGNGGHLQLVEPVKPTFKLRKSKAEDRLNKLEYSYLLWLRASKRFDWIGIQNITLKLADDTRLTVDFWTIENGVMQARETKGPWFPEDGKIKLKIAAHQFTMFEFWLVRKVDSMWNHELVSP